jgi:hypothetical protein
MKILKTYIYSHMAHLDLAKLSSEGIEAYLKDDNIVSIDPLYAHAVGGIKLMVHRQEYDKALEILNNNYYEDLKDEYPGEEISGQRKCILCGSINIYQKSSWLGGLLFLMFFFVPVTWKKEKYICMDCSYEWKE